MGAFLLLAFLVGGGWFYSRSAGYAEPEDTSYEEMVDTLLAQDDVKAKLASKPEFGGPSEIRKDLLGIYEDGATEERVTGSILLYAMGKNVEPDFKSDGTTSYKKSKDKPLTKKSSDLLFMIADRLEIRAAKEEPSAAKRTEYKARIDKERAAIDKAAASNALPPASEDGDDVATKSDLDMALMAIEGKPSEACFPSGFGAAMRELWDKAKPETLSEVSIELFAVARSVEFDGGTNAWVAGAGCPTVDKKAFTDLSDLFSNRAIMTSKEPQTSELATEIMKARAWIVAAELEGSGATPPPYEPPVETPVIAYEPSPVYSLPLPPEPLTYTTPAGYGASLEEAAPIFPVDTPMSGAAGEAYASISPYTPDIGLRLDFGPGTIWS
jgi:hypothetical protein